MSIAYTDNGKYVWIWKKYRPVILKLMMASLEEDQQEYPLSKHEFLDTNNKRPSGYAFDLRINHGKRETDIKKNLNAQDFLYVLKSSEKAKELLQNNLFEFKMDKSFVLSVSNRKD